MTRFKAFLLFASMGIIFVVPAVAQTGCKQTDVYYFGDSAGIPPAAYNIVYGGPFMDYYDIMIGCIPPSAAVESCPTCPKAAQPIVLSTGNTYIIQPDVKIPGLAGGLSLVRTWNSTWPMSFASLNVGIFGPNWRSNYEELVLINSNDHYIRYSRGDGSYWSFAFTQENSDSTYSYHVVAPANVKATLTTTAAGTWTITFHNGEQRVFDRPDGSLAGKLLDIVDRNGNTTQLTYDAAARLTTVTDPAGRHLNFTYGTGDQSNLVAGVTSDSDAGISLSYTYDPSLLRLTKVTLPDNTFMTFEYDSHGLISAVKDLNGKILEAHTYDDKGRGLTSSRAGGVDAITVSYPN